MARSFSWSPHEDWTCYWVVPPCRLKERLLADLELYSFSLRILTMKYFDSTSSENFLPGPRRGPAWRAPRVHTTVDEKFDFFGTPRVECDADPGARTKASLWGLGRKFSEDVESKYFIVKFIGKEVEIVNSA